MDKLKPCPFCGSNKLKIESSSSKCRDRRSDICQWVLYRHYIMSVRCNVCYARGCTVSGDVVIDPRYGDLVLAGYTTVEKIEERTIEAWNKRVNDEPVRRGHWIKDEFLSDEVNNCEKCSQCGELIGWFGNLPKYCAGCGALMDGGSDSE